MKIFKGSTFAEVYEKSLYDLMNNYDYRTAPRGLEIRENINTTLIIENPQSCLFTNERRSSQYKYLAAETLWYFSGRNDLDFIERFAKFWKQIANKDNTLNSAYGHLIFRSKNKHGFTQFQWAMESLMKDKDSRQALMTFNNPDYQYDNNKDFICTLNGMFNIRDNKLNFRIHMRSNDAVLGAPTDIPFFCLLQLQALRILREKYPELELGTYTHIIDSYHIYQRNFGLVKNMLSNKFESEEIVNFDKYDFIDSTGKPTGKFLTLMYSVESDTDISFDDKLYDYLLLLLKSGKPKKSLDDLYNKNDFIINKNLKEKYISIEKVSKNTKWFNSTDSNIAKICNIKNNDIDKVNFKDGKYIGSDLKIYLK